MVKGGSRQAGGGGLGEGWRVLAKSEHAVFGKRSSGGWLGGRLKRPRRAAPRRRLEEPSRAGLAPRLRAVETRRFAIPGALWLATRLCLSLAALGLAGLLIGGGTLASFNATTINPSNAFSTASVLMTNSGTSPCTAVMTAANCGTVNLSSNSGMSPGDIASGTISITNAGAAPALMTLQGTLDASSTASFDSHLNLTIFDNSSGYCVYGHSALPYHGACDNLTGLTAQVSADAFPSSSASTGGLTLPGLAGAASWAVNEQHTLTISVEVASGGTVPTGATGSLDLSWTGTSLPGGPQ